MLFGSGLWSSKTGRCFWTSFKRFLRIQWIMKKINKWIIKQTNLRQKMTRLKWFYLGDLMWKPTVVSGKGERKENTTSSSNYGCIIERSERPGCRKSNQVGECPGKDLSKWSLRVDTNLMAHNQITTFSLRHSAAQSVRMTKLLLPLIVLGDCSFKEMKRIQEPQDWDWQVFQSLIKL